MGPSLSTRISNRPSAARFTVPLILRAGGWSLSSQACLDNAPSRALLSTRLHWRTRRSITNPGLSSWRIAVGLVPGRRKKRTTERAATPPLTSSVKPPTPRIVSSSRSECFEKRNLARISSPSFSLVMKRRDATGGRGLSSISKKQSARSRPRSEEHTSELQSLAYLVCRLLLEKKKQNI